MRSDEWIVPPPSDRTRIVSRGIRPSRTQSTVALWAKSLLNAALFFAVFVAAMPFLAYRLLPASLPVPGPLRIAGGALCIAGLGLWVWCLDYFVRLGRGTPFPLDAPRELVTTGPFAVIRNPIMAAELGVVWGEVVWSGAVGIALYALLATLAGHLVATRIEEPELHERFGAAYDAYRQRVPRWLPTLRR
jgi:protein-S-isoprenylcysteine O-methyltransferase Ste14